MLGRLTVDVDRVVIGATHEQMIARGFIPVGEDFPVYHHPETHEEYALARTERKTGKGYAGFSFDTKAVTLEEDLGRRDLTVNAMARHEVTEVLVDPYGGQADLKARILRHVSPAFAEDPVRVLRVARFLARLGSDWTVAPETMELMHEMVRAGVLDELVGERVWVEIKKGLSEKYPEEMLKLMRTLGLFDRPCFAEYSGAKQANLELLQRAAHEEAPLVTLFALAFPRQWSAAETKKSKIPKEIRDVSHTLQLGLSLGLAKFKDMPGAEKVDLLLRMDAFRQTDRIVKIMNVLSYLNRDLIMPITLAVASVNRLDNGSIIAGITDTQEIQKRIQEARIQAVEKS
jgi:tRNA nucleotidyltransferase (CCA-adding enzyme)